MTHPTKPTVPAPRTAEEYIEQINAQYKEPVITGVEIAKILCAWNAATLACDERVKREAAQSEKLRIAVEAIEKVLEYYDRGEGHIVCHFDTGGKSLEALREALTKLKEDK